jgi:hypothetical protein
MVVDNQRSGGTFCGVNKEPYSINFYQVVILLCYISVQSKSQYVRLIVKNYK